MKKSIFLFFPLIGLIILSISIWKLSGLSIYDITGVPPTVNLPLPEETELEKSNRIYIGSVLLIVGVIIIFGSLIYNKLSEISKKK